MKVHDSVQDYTDDLELDDFELGEPAEPITPLPKTPSKCSDRGKWATGAIAVQGVNMMAKSWQQMQP